MNGPLLPAATAKKIPAVRKAIAAWASAPRSHPSWLGQPHELVRICGARSGRPAVNGSAPAGNGASMNWRQSR